MVLTGYARRVAGNLRPADVIDSAVVATGDPAEIASACLSAVDPALAERVREGDLLVVDGLLADGPGAENVVVALQAAGFAAVICRDARTELRAFSAGCGLPILPSAAAAAIGEGDLLRLDLGRGRIEAGGASWAAEPLDETTLAAVRRAQLLSRMRRVVEDEGYAEG